jgi:Tol biopolymer transport system component
LLFGDAHERLTVQRIRTSRGPVIGRPTVIPGVDPAAEVSWSPDSAQIVIAGSVNDERGLWIVNRDGSNPRRIVDDTSVRVEDSGDAHAVPVWSARGGIAFVGWPRKYERQYDDPSWWAIYVVAPDGSGLRTVTRPVRNPVRGRSHDVYDSAPSWSPDGRRLVYAHDVDYLGTGDLRTVVVAARAERRLRRAGGAPVWSPNGRYIAAISPQGDERSVQSVDVVPSRGGNLRRIRIPGIGGYLVDLAWRAE